MDRIIEGINNLRSKPEHVRQHILHVSTITCAVILLLLWVYSLGRTVTDTAIQARMGEDLKPLTSLKANLIGGYDSLLE